MQRKECGHAMILFLSLPTLEDCLPSHATVSLLQISVQNYSNVAACSVADIVSSLLDSPYDRDELMIFKVYQK